MAATLSQQNVVICYLSCEEEERGKIERERGRECDVSMRTARKLFKPDYHRITLDFQDCNYFRKAARVLTVPVNGGNLKLPSSCATQA